MIYPYNNANLSKWTRSEIQVQLDIPGRRLPMGWCDGTDEDEAQLRNMAEEEGLEGELKIRKRILKTGRQIWSLGEAREPETVDEDW
jgi:hypothetical protein